MKTIVSIMFVVFLVTASCSKLARGNSDVSFQKIDQYDSKQLESEAYKLELERAIAGFQRQAFNENKDIAEIMEKTINLLSKGILMEQTNIVKIQKTIELLGRNKVGKIAILDESKNIEEIYAMADQDYERIQSSVASGQLWDAAFLLSQFTTMYPITYKKLDAAFFQLAGIYSQLGLPSASREVLVNLIREIPLSDHFVDAYYLLFRVNYQLKQYQDNIALAREFYGKYPAADSLDLVRYYEGLSFFDLGDYRRTREIMDAIPQGSSFYSLAWYFSGLSMYLQKEPLAAYKLLGIRNLNFAGSEGDSLKTKALLTAVQIYADQDSLDNAVGLINVLKDSAFYARDEILFTAGEVLSRKKDLAGAQLILEELIRDFPQSNYQFLAQSKLMWIYKETNQLTQAQSMYDNLISQLKGNQYYGKSYTEIMARIDNRDQEILVLNGQLSIMDVLAYERFKFLHLVDYYNDKYRQEDYLSKYIEPTTTRFTELNGRLALFIEEKKNLESYLAMLSAWEQIEYQNAVIAYEKLLEK